ncbi:c-type cytochrome [Thermodesulfobacteriota bacterium]
MQRKIVRDILRQAKYIIGCLCTGKRAVLMTLISGIGFSVCFAPVLAQDPIGKDLKKFYQDNCVRCHGSDGSAVNADGEKLKGEDFTDQGWQQSTTDKKMVKVIMKGVFFGMAMPGFKDSLTEEEAQRMVTDIIRKSKKGQVIFTDTDNLAAGSKK